MSAEWSYFVNKNPLYVSVVLSPQADTRAALESSGESGLTLRSAGQAALVDFAGSFSTAEVDKSAGELIDFGQPVTTATPWVQGGVPALECELRQTVDLPGHRVYIAEAVATHRPAEDCLPLVKHGGMFQTGDPAQRVSVVAAAPAGPHRDRPRRASVGGVRRLPRRFSPADFW
ncbi:flavin reductase family protein [Streptomyces ureilyticus]|nr:flavin reductase [Streptomyces ureilyticus]